MTPNVWVEILKELPLSKTEQETVKRFEKEPEGKGFLPVSDILRTHKLHTESLEILTEGIDRFPTFSTARVVLIRELYEAGMIDQAWRHLKSSPTPLGQNTLAQKLSFRIHLMMGLEQEARSILDHMKKSNMIDQHTKMLAEKLDIGGLEAATNNLVQEFKDRGCELVLPAQKKVEPADVPTQKPVNEGVDQVDRQAAESATSDNFYVVSLKEIFNSTDIGDRASAHGKGIELDTKTLAEIYEKQGHYTKALAVYRRLAKKFPGHDLYRHKVGEMTRKEKEEKLDDELELDNEIIDQLESLEIIDRQIDYFESLLNRLSAQDKP